MKKLFCAFAIAFTVSSNANVLISHGKLVEDEVIANAVVGLKIFNNPYSWSFCSGTLISENVILTAGHCIKHNQAYGQIVFGKDIRKFLNGFQNTNTEIVEFKSDDVLVHPAYCGTGCSHDLALINFKTNKPLRYAPIPISKISAKKDDNLRFVGLGYDENDKNLGLMQFIDGKVSRLQGEFEKIIVNEFPSPEGVPGINPAGTIGGDSGGPVFKFSEQGKYEIVGVTSGKDSTNGFIFTNAVFDREWIENEVKIINDTLPSPSSIQISCHSHNPLKTKKCKLEIDVELTSTESRGQVNGVGSLKCRSTISGKTIYQKKLTEFKYSGSIPSNFLLETDGISIEATSLNTVIANITYIKKYKTKKLVSNCSIKI